MLTVILTLQVRLKGVKDFFPNSVQVSTFQMMGHALLGTNFNALQSHLQNKYIG